MRKFPIIILIILGLGLLFWIFEVTRNTPVTSSSLSSVASQSQPTASPAPNPLNIDYMRSQSYPGSDLTIEQILTPGANYSQYIASYMSDGLKIHGLLTVPNGPKPATGWPVIIFNHGYIPPDQYRTTERYVAYVAAFARSGYIVFKSDYRGNGSSEGEPLGAYYSPGYTIDVLNALATLKKYKDADPNRIGMWGHSMGGNITLRSLVISPDIKAAVIWGGVVGTYNDLTHNWQNRVSYRPPPTELNQRNQNRQSLISQYGDPSTVSDFWKSIDPNYHLDLITAPIQLDAGLSDEEVPWQFSEGLDNRLTKEGKTVEYYTYPGADHNIDGGSFELAMQRSVQFFDKYLK